MVACVLAVPVVNTTAAGAYVAPAAAWNASAAPADFTPSAICSPDTACSHPVSTYVVPGWRPVIVCCTPLFATPVASPNDPMWAAAAVTLTATDDDNVHGVRDPVSNPPLTTRFAGLLTLTMLTSSQNPPPEPVFL